MMGIGTNILGYGQPEVDEAVLQAVADESSQDLSLPVIPDPKSSAANPAIASGEVPLSPMTDDALWNLAAGRAREKGRSVQCGPSGPNRDLLVAEYQQAHKLTGVPPGSIVRPRG